MARLSWPGWLVTQWDSLPAQRQSPIPVLTGLNVEQLRYSRPTSYCYTKPPPLPQGDLSTVHSRYTLKHCTSGSPRGVFHSCFWPLKAPGYLGEGRTAFRQPWALWRQYRHVPNRSSKIRTFGKCWCKTVYIPDALYDIEPTEYEN